MNCIIIEDEPLAMERVKSYVQKLPFLHLLDTFDNGIDGLVYLQSHSVDLVFLDINLGELSGIRMLETSKLDCQVILTTAYHEYALKGYELNVTDYLLKPYTFERFMQAVEKARNNQAKIAEPAEKKFIFVKTEHRLEKISLSDVLYIEGMRDYRRIHTIHKRIMTLQTFRDMEQEIPSSIICRVHKSYMVSIDKIDFIEKDRIKIGDAKIPISETYKKGFYELIQDAGK